MNNVKPAILAALVALTFAAASISATSAAPPNLVRYQARLTDDVGVPLTGMHDLRFAIYDAESGGGLLWSEGPTSLQVEDGVVDLLLGQTTPVSSDLIQGGNAWIEVDVDGAVLGPRQRLTSVPFSLTTERLDDLTKAEVLDRSNHTGTQSPATISPQGAGSGLDADTVDGLDPFDRVNHAGTQPPASIAPQGTGSGLDADRLDGLESVDLRAGHFKWAGVLVFDNISSQTWTDLDLSGVVGANRAVVFLRVVQTQSGASGYAFRPNGETFSGATGGASGFDSGGVGAGYVLVETDESGTVEWQADQEKDTQISLQFYARIE